LELWAVSLCNLHPNTILHISIFIHFCEAYLRILPHFNLFRHLFWLKKRGGPGSKVVGRVYLQLRDGMAGEYLTVPLTTSLKGWNARWFYMRQSHPAIRCDTDHILENQRSWSETPSSDDMEQVKELLGLIKGVRTNDRLVAVSFIVRCVQPCKERAHPGFEFKGETDGTRERLEILSRNVVEERTAELFAPLASFRLSGYTKPFNCKNLPPQVNIAAVCF